MSGFTRPWCWGDGWSQASEDLAKLVAQVRERKRSASQEGRVIRGLRPKVL